MRGAAGVACVGRLVAHAGVGLLPWPARVCQPCLGAWPDVLAEAADRGCTAEAAVSGGIVAEPGIQLLPGLAVQPLRQLYAVGSVRLAHAAADSMVPRSALLVAKAPVHLLVGAASPGPVPHGRDDVLGLAGAATHTYLLLQNNKHPRGPSQPQGFCGCHRKMVTWRMLVFGGGCVHVHATAR